MMSHAGTKSMQTHNSKRKKKGVTRVGSGTLVRLPANSSIRKMKRLYRRLCESHPDPRVQRIAQGMETALRWAKEETKGWRMTEEPMLLAQCLIDDLKVA